MTRAELIAYLEHKADAFEGNPVHVDMSKALRAAVCELEFLESMLKPSRLLSEQPPQTPDGT